MAQPSPPSTTCGWASTTAATTRKRESSNANRHQSDRGRNVASRGCRRRGRRDRRKPLLPISGRKVSALLSGQRDDGAFSGEPGIIRRYRGNSRSPEDVVGVDYVLAGVARHWKSTQWRLVSLVELAIPPDEPRAVAAANYVLNDFLDRRQSASAPRSSTGCRAYV